MTTIKVGDMVVYGGVRQRVMGVNSQGLVRLSKRFPIAWFDTHSITLVEPHIPKDIKPGDVVSILDIPDEEQNFWHDANKPLEGDTFRVDDVVHNDMCGTLIYIRENGQIHIFMEPYVEKISDYDII